MNCKKNWSLYLLSLVLIIVVGYFYVYRPYVCTNSARKAAHDYLMMNRSAGLVQDFYNNDIYQKEDFDKYYQECLQGLPLPAPVNYSDD